LEQNKIHFSRDPKIYDFKFQSFKIKQWQLLRAFLRNPEKFEQNCMSCMTYFWNWKKNILFFLKSLKVFRGLFIP